MNKQTYKVYIHVQSYTQKFANKIKHTTFTYITRYVHTHTHTRARARARTHTHTRARARAPRTHAPTRTHTRTHATCTIFKHLAMLHPTLRLCTPANG